MVQKLRERSQGEGGFTLVELLVVMLILGLLAAIAIPSFFNQRDKASDADAKSSVRTAQTAIETYATDNNGNYALADAAELQAIEPTLNDAPGAITVTPTVGTDPQDEGYSVSVAQPDTGNVFSIARNANTSQVTYTCTTVSTAGCPSDGNWGD
jgi:type IV pilus assembly protein PilA